MGNSKETGAKVIQLDVPDSIFEWDVLGNTIHLSQGARSQLALGDRQCLSMDEFSSHTPHDERLALMASLSNFLHGAGGTSICFSHNFDEMLVSARMTVVDRRDDGMVTRVIGTVQVHSAHSPFDPFEDGDRSAGFWRLRPLERTIRFDRRSMALLGSEQPAITEITTAQLKRSLHREDVKLFLNRFGVLLSEGRWEGPLNHSFRYRTAGGKYRRFAVSAAVLEYDEQERVVEMVGSMQLVSGGTAVARDENGMESESFVNAIAATEDGFWDWDVQDDLFRCSPRYLSILGYSRDEFPTSFDKVKELVHPDDLHKYDSMLQRVVHSANFGKSFEFACRMRRADGVYAWQFVRGYITHRDYDGMALKVVGLSTDISGTQDGWAHVEAQFRNDDLTDLRSRAFLTMECERLEKANMRPVSVIVVDLDGLKLVNDYLGHLAGDDLLKELASLMRRVLRTTDCVARMGGDEFTVLLPSCTGKNARLLASRLGEELDKRNAGSDSLPLLISIGVGSAETGESTLDQAIADADSEMLRNKHRRRQETHRILKEFIQNAKNVVVREDENRHL